MNTKFKNSVSALEARDAAMRLVQERGIDANVLFQAIVDALEETYAQMPGSPNNFRVLMDPSTFEFSVMSYDNSPEGEIFPLPEGLGTRVAATKFNDVLKGRVNEAEKESAVREFEDRQGTIVEGVVRSVTDSHAVVEVAGVAGELRAVDQIPGESLDIGSVVSCYLTGVAARRDLPLLLSRSSRDTVYALMMDRVEELRDGSVEILELDREAGRRTKVVVAAAEGTNGGVRDAVGAVIGVNGRKINSIQEELADERIDVCGWSPDPYEYLAELLGIDRSYIKSGLIPPGPPGPDREPGAATVAVPTEAMGRILGIKGCNVRMAEKISAIAITVEEIYSDTGY